MRIRKPWTEWDDEINFKSLPGAMGVFEIADEDRKTINIGKASGKSPFGLRGELFLCFADTERLEDANWTHPKMGQVLPTIKEKAKYYRYEVNHMYYSRWIEILTRFNEDHGRLPSANLEDQEDIPKLGRYHWKTQESAMED